MNRKRSQQTHSSTGLATCACAVTAAKEIQLFPAWQFGSIDSRPIDVPYWLIDAALAAQIIGKFESRVNRTVVDYEHQTLLAA
ncbi:Mu-like prophage I protein [Nitrosomonas communis]|uniref:Mu-like prophage I protein n=1 Tax=Nitrosomonas communis TaxID=44574 RepID=A0A1I4VAE3_9PROT|nr:Mu-like prophage I protein [Nitrosomonas communis]